jgi:thiamine kinase-like enzyme
LRDILALDKNQIAEICSAFHLGNPVNDIVPVRGGLIHRMWRLDTNSGSYAIKELDAAIMKRPRIHESYIQSEEISAALKRQNIPAETALINNMISLFETGGAIVMVYPWINGRTLTFNEITSDHAKQIGRLVAAIHAVNMTSLDLPLPEIHSITTDGWQALIIEARSQQLSWAEIAEKNITNLITWSEQYENAQQQLNKQLIISHRDMDPKNVIWRDANSPVLIDWEGAGLINPTAEIINVAMEWAGMTEVTFRENIFAAVISGYRANQGRIATEEVQAAIHGLMGGLLDWLEFNMFRSIDSSKFDTETQQLGVTETAMTLNKLHFISQNTQYLQTKLSY